MANRDTCSSTLIEVKPGDETGIYHILFCNLPFKATWQELKDWLSESCTVDFVETFPVSCSGWVCIQGKENFETLLAYMKTEHFKGRPLIFDDKNKSESIRIRVRIAGPKPKYPSKYSHLIERNQDRRTPLRYSNPQMRQYGSYSNRSAKVRNEAMYASSTAEMMEFTDLLSVLACMTALYKPLPMPYYPPTLAFPGNGWNDCHGMDSCNPCPLSDGEIPTPPDSPDVVLPDSAAPGGDEEEDDPYDLDDIPGNVRERRAQSLPPSFRWVGNETSE
ncbi:hypothetical protein GGI43DRAFT_429415 [Trichoderma evansii]